ncbi:MAG: hypothetical protein AAF927_01905 [Bacteroidota bacterium]
MLFNRYFLLTLIILSACQSSEENVRQAAKKYLDARLNDDFSRAMLCVSPDSYEALEDLASMAIDTPPADGAMQYRITEITVNGDTAKVAYELENYFSTEFLKLEKTGETWLIKLGLNDIPDPAMLARDLTIMESEDTITKLQRELDKLLLEEDDSLEQEFIIPN